MITPGTDYYLVGNIYDQTGPSNAVNIRANDNDQVTVGSNPIPSGEEDYYTFTALNGSATNSWTLTSLALSSFLQPVADPPDPTVEDAQTLSGTFNLYITPISDESPDVYFITTGANATGNFMTVADANAGSDVTFQAKITPDSSKQKWRFSKTTHLVKPLKEVPEKKGLFGFLKKKK